MDLSTLVISEEAVWCDVRIYICSRFSALSYILSLYIYSAENLLPIAKRFVIVFAFFLCCARGRQDFVLRCLLPRLRWQFGGCWSAVRVVTFFSFLCPLLEKYGTFIARCNALIEKVPSFRALALPRHERRRALVRLRRGLPRPPGKKLIYRFCAHY